MNNEILKEQIIDDRDEDYYIDILEDPNDIEFDIIKNDEIIEGDNIIDFPKEFEPETSEIINIGFSNAKDSDTNLPKKLRDNFEIKKTEIKVENIPNNKTLNESYLEKIQNRENFLSDIFKKHKKKEAITYGEKIKLVQLINDNVYSLHSLSEKIGFDRRDIRLWVKNYDEMLSSNEPNRKRKTGAGKEKTIPDIIKDNLLVFIQELRSNHINVTNDILIRKLKAIDNKFENYTIKRLQQIIYRFLKNNNFSLRKITHIGQKIPNNSLDLFYYFFHIIHEGRVLLKIDDNENDLNRIINMDETPIFFEIYHNYTYDKKGKKSIIIDTNGGDKQHITVLLTTCGGGKKLPPLLVFKGIPNATVEKRYNQLECVRKKKLFIFCQNHAWCDDTIFKYWFEKIFLNYEKNIAKKKCFLLIDKAPSHKSENSLQLMKNNKTYYKFIFEGMTKYLQPNDIGLNKVFKDRIKNEYLNMKVNEFMNNNNEIDYLTQKFKDNKKISDKDIQRLKIIDMVMKVWYDDDLINKVSITNSYLKAGITYPLDGSMDDEFEFPEEVLNQK